MRPPKCESGLCQNCVTYPLKPPLNTVIYEDMVTRIDACSIDHSDISPFRNQRLAGGLEQSSAEPPFTHIRFDNFRGSNRLARRTRGRQTRIVSDLLMSCDHLRPFDRDGSADETIGVGVIS